ncbi:helix-turn-helix domain-containing protein, partial [Mycolicibacterium poriferae]|uniref:helix-turn-helix domain-containing protein n=1 Tax=Mycolicibacterium poriferae TaxID=39694 RepID=UPI003D2F9553
MKIRTQRSTAPDPVPSHAVDGDTHGHTRGAIIRLLLESGPTTAGRIGDELGLSAAGVRRHLDALIEA